MFKMKFGHGLVIEANRAWGIFIGDRGASVFSGRVLECDQRWCVVCQKFLEVGELVVVVEEIGNNRRFYHDMCLPDHFRTDWLEEIGEEERAQSPRGPLRGAAGAASLGKGASE